MLNRIALPLLFMGLLTTTLATAQVKIGDNPQNINATSLLELQSNDKVLVITRVDAAQMATIVPTRGALVYNTTENCVFYYDGSQWVNLCEGGAAAGNLTADPIVNDISTIVITQSADGSNFEIAPNSINSEQIVNGGINGIDIQDGSIGQGKLQNNSVTQDKLSENSVGAFALDNDNINLSDFTNDQGFITNADIISNDAGNSIQPGSDNGAFYDDSLLVAEVAANTTANAADTDQSPTNEFQNLSLTGDQLTITDGNTITLPTFSGSDTKIENGANTTVAGNGTTGTPYQINVTGVDTDITNELTDLAYNPTTNILTLTNPATATNEIDLSGLAGGGTADGVISNVTWNETTSELTFTGTPGAFNNVIDLSSLEGGTGTNQNAAEVPVAATPANYTAATADVEAHLIGIDAALASAGVGAQDISEVLTEGNDAGAAGITNLTTDGTDNTAAATVGFVNAQIAAGGQPLNDGLILVGDATDNAQSVAISGDATMDNAGVLTIQNDSITSLKIKDATIALEDLSDMGATADGEILQWNTAANSGAGGWEIGTSTEPTGTAKSIFFADTDGTPTTTEDNTNPNDDFGLIWDTNARPVSSNTYGALYVGRQAGSPAPGNNSKVVISERIGPSHPQQGLSYPLQLQNENGTDTGSGAAGILFAVESLGSFGKGGLVYERIGPWGIGDFHFLQNQVGDNSIPTLTDKAFTIQNDGDIQLYGNLIAQNGAGSPSNVLTINSAGETVWGTGGGGLSTVTTDGTTITGNGTDVANAIALADNAVSTAKLQDGSVNSLKIVDDAVTSAKILDGEIQTADILNGTILAEDLADMGAANDQVLKWNGTAWAPAADAGGVAYTAGSGLTLSGANEFSVDNLAGEVNGPTTATVIADNTINSAKIVDGEVQTADILNGTILAEDLADMGAANDQVLKWNGTIWAPANDAGGVAYTAGTGLTLSGANEFSVDDLAGEVTGPTTATVIANNTINSAKIVDGEVQTADILNGTILAEDLADMGAANDQVLKWNGTAWAPANDAGGVAYTAGAGLTLTGSNFSVNVDDASIEIASGNLQIKDGGITNVKLDKVNIPLSGFGNPTADINLNSQKIINLAVPTLDTDAATKKYVDDNAGSNLSNANLTQTAAVRTYEIGSGQSLTFTGAGFLGFGNGANPPLDKFHFAGEVRVEGINSSAGTEGSPAYSFSTSSDTDTGMYRPAADEIGFSVGGNEALHIDEPTKGETNVTVRGSFSTNIRTDNSGGTVTIEGNDYTVIFNNASDITLPAPATTGTGINVGKIYILKNVTGAPITIDQYSDSDGVSTTTLDTGVTQLQSDGTTWHQIN
ncbi:beta strand repeat-containing protein [Euzebyella saccharophila]|uniref:Beta strand repeat-containing protein n=1 Tax=Euzebyella saccharophila TaxID=679664 RepID=A0ABV8JPW5_9FLAO|nr:hypothetical protein [Euzebyella saccharophila]